MIRRPPRSTRTDTLFPYTTLFRSVKGVEVEVAILLAALDIGLVADDEDIDFADHERQHRVDPREFAFECRRARLREIAAMIGESQRQDRLVAAVMRFENRPDRAMLRGAPVALSSEECRGGKECVSMVRFRWSRNIYKKKDK